MSSSKNAHDLHLIKEFEGWSLSGGTYLIFSLIMLIFIIFTLNTGPAVNYGLSTLALCTLIVWGFGLTGLFIVGPNEAKVMQFFGKYKGSVRHSGLRWSNPLYSKKTVSLKIRNFESPKLKVNDLSGNPIEIASIIVWRVVDSAEALFQVLSFEEYVRVQSEAAIRNLAMQYPYDSHDGIEKSLHGSPLDVTANLKKEVQARLDSAGVEVLEARLSHLAYAPEIALTMLQRQQAAAIIGARQKIVDGAVGMVEMALHKLSKNNIVELDEEKKATMVSNLLVVLCSEKSIQPVVSAGTTN